MIMALGSVREFVCAVQIAKNEGIIRMDMLLIEGKKFRQVCDVTRFLRPCGDEGQTVIEENRQEVAKLACVPRKW